jgi:hypothetical protein
MTEIGAPGDGISRRAFLAATGATGLGAAAGCTAPAGRRDEGAAAAASASDDLPSHYPVKGNFRYGCRSLLGEGD